MNTVSDRYGDLDLEDLSEDEQEVDLEPENEAQILSIGKFQRSEFRSFELDFGHKLDETLANLEKRSGEWDDYDQAQADEDYKAYTRHRRDSE